MTQRGILLVNLGSPDSPSIRDVRRYLREFLMDKWVLDVPYLTRFFVVHFCILPFRPRKTAEAYHKIWLPEGSPLMVTSHKVQAALQKRLGVPVGLAMRYQNPSLESAIGDLAQRNINEILLFPLYPHYALSSYTTVVERVKEVLAKLGRQIGLKVMPPFYNEPDYIDALAASASDYLPADFDHLLFSFHGLPERHLRKADPTGRHCLVTDNCCTIASPAHPTCYRAQAIQSVSAFVKKTGWPQLRSSIAFQSRLGRDPWLRPYTDHELVRLAQGGVRKLLVICPSFVSDCLETLEEIGLRGRESFRHAGGSDLTLIPCLNEHPQWISALVKMVERQWGIT